MSPGMNWISEYAVLKMRETRSPPNFLSFLPLFGDNGLAKTRAFPGEDNRLCPVGKLVKFLIAADSLHNFRHRSTS